MENKKNSQIMTEEEFLSKYEASKFEKPSVTVDNVIFRIFEEKTANYRKNPEKALYILLIKRGEHPFIDKWALPGGFVRINESLEEAAYRELKEETNLDNLYIEQLYTFGAVERDPRMRIISTSYMALIQSDELKLKASTDAKEAKWFKLTYHIEKNSLRYTLTNNELILQTELNISDKVMSDKDINIISTGDLAFDHAKIIGYALMKLRKNITSSEFIFHLMPQYFTLTDLQTVYEIILGEKLIPANFRRKIKHRVKETDYFTSESGHRPSRLFCFIQDE